MQLGSMSACTTSLTTVCPSQEKEDARFPAGAKDAGLTRRPEDSTSQKMPTYEYVCEACGHQWEAFQSIKDDPLRACPSCEQPKAKRQISAGSGFILKGGGWYSDLYASSGGASSSGGSSTASSSSSTSSSSESTSSSTSSDSSSTSSTSSD